MGWKPRYIAIKAARVAIERAVVRQTIIVAVGRLAMGRALLTNSGATMIKVAKLVHFAWAAVDVARRLSEARACTRDRDARGRVPFAVVVLLPRTIT